MAQGDPWAGFNQQKGEDPWAGFGESKGEDPWAGFGGGAATAAPPDTSGFEIKPEEPGGVQQRPFMFRGPGTAPAPPSEPGALDYLKAGGAFAANAAAQGFADIGEETARLGERFRQNILKKTNETPEETAENQRRLANPPSPFGIVKKMREIADAKFKPGVIHPDLEGGLFQAGSEAVGGIVPGVGAALAAPEVALPAMVGLGGAQSAGGAYNRVLQETGDPEKAGKAEALEGVVGAAGSLATLGALKGFPALQGVSGPTKAMIGTFFAMQENGLGSSAQAALNTIIENKLTGEQKSAWEAAKRAYGPGAIGGAVAHAAGGLAGAHGARGEGAIASDEPQEAPRETLTPEQIQAGKLAHMAGVPLGVSIGGEAGPSTPRRGGGVVPGAISTEGLAKKAPPATEGAAASGLPERIPSGSGQGTVPQGAGAGGPEEIDLGDRRAVERPGQPERRQNAALRQRLTESDQEAALKALRLHGQGDELGALAVMQEQNKARTEAVAAAHEEARTDALTGLPNKRQWAERDLTGKSVISGDLDGLKWVNDNLGHEAGDKYLKAVADVVRQEDPEGKFARVGGDEFNGEGDSRPEAEDLAKRIQDRLANTTVDLGVHNGERIVKKGIGISFGHGETEGEADKAMYENKAQRAEQGLRRADNKQEPPGIVRTPEAPETAAAQEAKALPEKPFEAVESAPEAEKPSEAASPPMTPPPPEGEAGGEPQGVYQKPSTNPRFPGMSEVQARYLSNAWPGYEAPLSEKVKGPLYHETSLAGARALLGRTEGKTAVSHTGLATSDNPDLALGQGGRGVRLELDSSKAVGAENKSKPGLAYTKEAGGGTEYNVSATAKGIVRAIEVKSKMTLAALKRTLGDRFDFDNAQKTEYGWRVERKAAEPKSEAESPGLFKKPPESRQAGAEEPPKAEEPPAAEPAPERPPTSTKNAVTEQERAERGATPLEDTISRSMPETWKMAEDASAADPTLGERIIKGEPVRGLERDVREAVLLREKVTTQNEAERVAKALEAAQESGDEPAVKALTEQADAIEARSNEIDLAAKREGTEWGRSGRIRQMLVDRDYSIASVTSRFRAAKGGPLTAAERAEAARHSERLLALEKQVQDIEAKLAQQSEAKAAPEKTISTRSKVISYLDAQAEAARARLAAKRRQASGGIPFDPADIADVARIAASHIAHGIDAAARLVSEFGESIKPHIQEILARAKQIHEEAPKRAGSEKAAITRATKTAGLLRAKTAAGDFEAAPKPEPLPMTKERLAAKTDLEEARREYESAKGKFRFQNRTKLQKARDAAREALTLPRQMMASFDLSATLFQGGLQSATHPIISTKALGESVRSFMSERRALEVDTALRNRPNAAAGDKAGLELTQLEGPLSAHEEQMRSNWAGKIPFIGKGIEASNRAFTTFLNVQRALVFDKLTDAMPDKSPEAQNAAANFINVATGRGYTPAKFRAAMSTAANVLWSPRLWLSRMQLLAGQPLYRGTAASRRAIAGEYAKGLIALGGVYSLAALAGGKIEDDPRSSNFGKIKSGNVYLDPTLGMAQNVTLLSRMVTGQTKTQGGKIEPLRAPIFGKGKGPTYGQSSTADVLGRFLRTKLSPTLGIPIDIASGSNVAGQPVSLKSGLASGLVPMSFMDIYQAMQDGGVPEATAIGLLSIFGAHVQVRQPNKPGHASAGR